MATTTDASIFLVAATLLAGVAVYASPQPCDSPVYCYGDLLKTVQLAQIFDDDKTFVDKKQKFHTNDTLQYFEDLMIQTGGNPTRAQIEEFVNSTFEDGNELQVYTPEDWTANPAFLEKILDPDFKNWARDLNTMWKNLTRKMSDTVRDHQNQYSIIYVSNPFVVPGGRFREFYYWDTYWIVQGLLLSEMYETTRGMLENFLSMVAKYGFIPNGGRVYYEERSQPPLLIPMVDSYFTATNNITFLRNNIQLLDAEFQFWMANRTVNITKNGKDYTLARYYAVSEGPRPESYSDDYLHAQDLHTEEEKRDFYINIKSAAESGWDFSSRWYITNGRNTGNITAIRTEYVIPVDLNAFLYQNAALLAKFYQILGDLEKSQYYNNVAENWKAAVTAIHWNEELGTWLDYDVLNDTPRKYFYPSNLAPLWTNCYDPGLSTYYANRSVNYIDNATIRQYLGGIPTSFESTNEQWDFPNAWPPLQIIAIQGLAYTNDPAANALAYELAGNWVHANHKGYRDSEAMFEKYNAVVPGRYGAGGEYNVQTGFGWTNGVIMELLNTYGTTLTSETQHRRYIKRRWARSHTTRRL